VCLCVSAIQVSGNEYVEDNSAIQLMCNATGRPDPPHNVDWFKDGQIVHSDVQRGLIVTKKIESRLLVNVDWFKDGQIVHSDVQRGLIVTKKIESRLLVSVLSIRFARLSDAGQYVCLSSDGESAAINVHVLSGTSVFYIIYLLGYFYQQQSPYMSLPSGIMAGR